VTRIAGGFEGIIVGLDIETNPSSPDDTMSPDQGDAWAGEFTERTGQTPLIYGGGYLREHGGAVGHAHLAKCPLWLAEYGDTPLVLPGWQSWTIWQFTDGNLGPYAGQVPGIGRCDQNVYNGDRPSFEQFWRAFSNLTADARMHSAGIDQIPAGQASLTESPSDPEPRGTQRLSRNSSRRR